MRQPIPKLTPVARKGDELLGYPVGFVYVLSNPTMPGLVKIGRTDRLIATRAAELQSTGVPLPFDVEYGLMTSYPGDVEKRAQDLLTPFRVASNREFFRVPVPQAILAVQEAAEDAAGIGRWAGSCHRISCGERLALSMCDGQLLIVMHYPDHRALFDNELDFVDIWQAHSDGDRLDMMCGSYPEHVVSLSDDSPASALDPIPYLDHDRRVSNAMINGKERLYPGDRLVWVSGGPHWRSVQWAVFEIADYCQVISRTRALRTFTDGYSRMPLTLKDNISIPRVIPPTLRQAVNEARAAVSIPGTWTQRYSDEAPNFGAHPLTSQHWLQGLVQYDRRRRR